ncbi:MAG: hypothetical protein ABI624_11030 [Casimicrobiaceae bacterium]
MGIGSAQVIVKIRAPLGATDVPGLLDDWELPLRSLSVSNNLDSAGGHFVMELAPEFRWPSANRGMRVADLIKPTALVSIALGRHGRGWGATNAALPVMLGLVDRVSTSELWAEASPFRSVIVEGRSLGGLLNDHHWWFHNYLALNGGVQVPPDVRQFFRNPSRADELDDESALRQLGFLAIDDKLFDLANRSPVALMKVAYDFFVVGDPKQSRAPFIKLKFGGLLGRDTEVRELPLAFRLRFDADAAQRSYVDRSARLAGQFMPVQMPEASCWDLLRTFAEVPFTEIFADTFGSTVDDAFVQIIVRKPPFAGHIDYAGETPFVTGSRPPSGSSLFDDEFGDWHRREQTIGFDHTAVVSEPSMTRGLEGAYSLYDVQPQLFANAGSGTGDRFFSMSIPALPDIDEASPSYIQRIGIRPLRVPLRSIATLAEDNESPLPTGLIQARALSYAALLYEWNYRNPDLWRGSYTFVGNPNVRVGKRLVDRDRRREFYVTAVLHSWQAEDNVFRTSCAVSRGRDITSNRTVI